MATELSDIAKQYKYQRWSGQGIRQYEHDASISRYMLVKDEQIERQSSRDILLYYD